MQSLCFLNVNYSGIKVITHMRHRIIVSFEITPTREQYTASLHGRFMEVRYRPHTPKSLNKLNFCVSWAFTSSRPDYQIAKVMFGVIAKVWLLNYYAPVLIGECWWIMHTQKRAEKPLWLRLPESHNDYPISRFKTVFLLPSSLSLSHSLAQSPCCKSFHIQL